MAAIATKLHSVFNVVLGGILVGAVLLASMAADFCGFLLIFDVPSIAAECAFVCTSLRFRGLAFARAAWRHGDRSRAIIFVVCTALAVLISSGAELDYFLSCLKSEYRSEFQEQAHQVLVVLAIQFFSVFLADAWFGGDYDANEKSRHSDRIGSAPVERSGSAITSAQAQQGSESERHCAMTPTVNQMPALGTSFSEAVNNEHNAHSREAPAPAAERCFAWTSNHSCGRRRSCRINPTAAMWGRDRFQVPEVAVGLNGRRRRSNKPAPGRGQLHRSLKLHVSPRPFSLKAPPRCEVH